MSASRTMAIVDSKRLTSILHLVYAALVVIVIGFSVPRLFMNIQPRSRANTIAIGMGAKSLVILSYIVLTEHCRPLKRYASLKANLILSGLEVIFWAAVVFLVMQANLQVCNGVVCGLSWSVVTMGIVLSMLASFLTLHAYRQSIAGRKARKGASEETGNLRSLAQGS